ncbi:MAG TPA: thioredoxin domain-containing protein [Polyangiaceae bacterium]|nr:thioredoxin domain-containing protein [Polyangiaceae bacterium]
MGIPRLEAGSLFAGELTVVRPLVSGRVDGGVSSGDGSTYLVEHRSTGSQRALKLLDPELVGQDAAAGARERFEQAAHAGARVESDHVVQVVDAGVDAATGAPWLTMELLRGEDLATRMTRGPESFTAAREIVTQLCHALAAAHETGIVHRDLRPENVFLAAPRREGIPFTVKVLGFGLATFAAGSGSRPSAPGATLWVAPEEDATAALTPAADLWSLGLLAYFVLTGRPFWRGRPTDAPAALRREIGLEPLPSATERAGESGVGSLLPKGFDAWFRRCVSREPGARFASVREARAAFDALAPSAEDRPSNPDRAPLPVPASPAYPPPPVTGFSAPPVPAGAAGSPFRHPAPGWPPPPPQATGSSAAPWLALGLAGMLIVALGGSLAGFVAYRKRARAPKPTPVLAYWSDVDSPVPVTSRDPVWGERDAPVTLVEFSDLQCPFCSRAEKTVAQLKGEYGPAKLRVVWKNQPLSFHANAQPAAEAAQVVFEKQGSTAFWEFQRLAFENQTSLERASYIRWATGLGVEERAFTLALDGRQSKYKIQQDQDLAKRVGATGTPTFFVNGLRLNGAQPVESFRKLIDPELEKAAVKVAAGTRKDRLYVELSRDNYAAPPPKSEPPPRPAEDSTRVHNVPVGASPVSGPATAPVTIVIFSDYQCPFCKRAEKTLAALRETFGDKLRFVWKDQPLPFHSRAIPALELAHEARRQRGDAGFWKVHDLLMASPRLEDDDLKRIAGEANLDVAKAMAAVARRPHWSASSSGSATSDDALLAKRLHVSGTPRFFINGRSLVGAQPPEAFSTIIREELAHAERLVKSGTSPAGVYAAIMATAVDEDLPSPPIGGAVLGGDLAPTVTQVDVKVGTGMMAASGDRLKVHYVGTLGDGTEFDSSRKREAPFEFELGAGHVIKGWDQGLAGMRVGGTRRLVIPPSLAYGAAGHAPIPPNATLTFVVELLEVKAKR